MALKVTIENMTLRRSPDGRLLQSVAIVHLDGMQYRIWAPPDAAGPALDWTDQFTVRLSSADAIGSETEVFGDSAEPIIRAVVGELKKGGLQGDIWNWGNSPNATHYAGHVCLHGHVLGADGFTIVRQDEHCAICGQRSVSACTHCDAPIRGKQVMSSENRFTPPSFCYNCGHAYPWMEERLQTARELLYQDDKLSPEDRKKLWGLLQHVMSDPKSDLAAARGKLIEINLKGAAAATRELLLDLTAKVIAEMSKP